MTIAILIIWIGVSFLAMAPCMLSSSISRMEDEE